MVYVAECAGEVEEPRKDSFGCVYYEISVKNRKMNDIDIPKIEDS